MKENCNTCDPCEENFWNEVKEIVDNEKLHEERPRRKKKEVQDAFSEEESKTANNCPRKNGNKAFPQGEQTYRAKTKEEGTFSRSFSLSHKGLRTHDLLRYE